MLEKIKSAVPDFAKDIKLNISNVLTETAELSQQKIVFVALSVAFATKSPVLIDAVTEEADSVLNDAEKSAAKAAASIMAMNNIYYRFVHMVSDKDYMTMPAQLRMNVIANPSVDKILFELAALAVSAINGCGLCMDAHVKTLEKSGLSKVIIQQAVRIAAVLNAAAQVLVI